MLSCVMFKIAKLVLSLFLISFIAVGCGGSGGGGGSGTSSYSGGFSGTWEGGMFPGHSISFEVEEINGEYYITSASGDYVAIGCFNDFYFWESNDLQNKIANNECHIYFPDDLNFGDGRGMELHIYFDSDTEAHGTWVGETFCEPLIKGTLKAYHCIDNDNDGYDSCNECDDNNANIHWDADEICDGVDNDCDGEIDEGLFYPDNDDDGYGDKTSEGQSCPVPENYVRDNTDCNDSDSSISPGKEEICSNYLDDNCNSQIDEGCETISTISVNNPGDIAITPNGDYLYVISSPETSVVVIRTSDHTIIDTVSVGISPANLAVAEDAQHVYVTNSSSNSNSVSVIRASDNTVIDTIPVGYGAYPKGIDVLPSGDFVYVTNYMDKAVTVIQISDNTVINDISVGSDSVNIMATPSGDYVYATHGSTGDVSVIRTSDNTVIDTIQCTYPIGIATTPDGEYIYVTNRRDTGTVSVIRTSDNTVTNTISVGPNPVDVTVAPDGEYVYVVNRGIVIYTPGDPSGNTERWSGCSVSVILASNNTVLHNIPMGNGPSSIAITPTGDYAYLTVPRENLITVIGFPD